jgi:hypothetical protein
MLPLETKQSGGKILPYSDIRGEVFLEESPRTRKRKSDILFKLEDNIKMDLQEVGGGLGTGWSWLRIGRDGGRL